MKKMFPRLALLITLFAFLTSCLGVPDIRSRSDMPIRGNRVVSYDITTPANSEQVDNAATLKGVGNDEKYPPFPLIRTLFDAMSGLKGQEVEISGDVVLGMTKPEIGIGFSRSVKVESASICAHDFSGKALCGDKIRVKFNHSLVQLSDFGDSDYDAIMYYAYPAEWLGADRYNMHFDQAQLLSTTINQVTQIRLWGPSLFYNWGHSIVIRGGQLDLLPRGWWFETDQIEGNYNDIHDAARLLSSMVADTSTSSDPWKEFRSDGQFTASWITYSAGDADRYATVDRIFLNRQVEYIVWYRPNPETSWDFIRVVPSYNFEFNDFKQLFDNYVLKDHVDKATGYPSNNVDPKIAEIEKIGCQNCPNAALEQVLLYDSQGKLLYSVTFRAFVGAEDTLTIWGPDKPPSWREIANGAPVPPDMPRPIDHDQNGKALADEKQTFKNDQVWKEFLGESTIWLWLTSENPLTADLLMKFRVRDSSEWAPIPCSSDGGICGYRATRWNLNSSYYFNGQTEEPWTIFQLVGEVGARVLGFSYVSGRYEGAGLFFAMAQDVFLNRYYNGFGSEEDIFVFDARALTTPEHLARAWYMLHHQDDGMSLDDGQ